MRRRSRAMKLPGLAVLAGMILLLTPALRAAVDVGEEVPDLKYTRLDGKECSLSEHRGKVVVIDFFSTGWLLSLNNVVHMETLHRRYKDRGVVVLGLARNNLAEVKAFVDERPGDVTYTVGRSADGSRKFRVGYIPHVFIIDPQGRLYWHGEPRKRPYRLKRLWAVLDEKLEALVKGWPKIRGGRGRRELAEALEKLDRAETPGQRLEGYDRLKELLERYAEDEALKKQIRGHLKKVEKERSPELEKARRIKRQEGGDGRRPPASRPAPVIPPYCMGSELEYQGRTYVCARFNMCVRIRAGTRGRADTQVRPLIPRRDSNKDTHPYLQNPPAHPRQRPHRWGSRTRSSPGRAGAP